MKRFLYLFCALPVMAQTIPETIQQTQSDIAQAATELQALRISNDLARRPLLEELDQLQTEVAAMRAELEQLAGNSPDQTELSSKLRKQRALHDNSMAALLEYRRSMETRTNPADAQHFDFSAFDQRESDDLANAAAFILKNASEWAHKRVGPYSLEGTIVGESGLTQKGRFICFGPQNYFMGENGTMTGIARTKTSNVLPSIYRFPGDSKKLAALKDGNEAYLPVDLSNGQFYRLAAAKEPLTERLKKGGFVMIPLTITALWAIVLIFLKFFDLARLRCRDLPTEQAIIQAVAQGQPDEAKKLAATLPALLSGIIREGLQHGERPPERIEELMHEKLLANMPGLERHLGALAVLGAVAPLLGLLGTVTGMIHTFDLVTLFGTGNAGLLSGGISEALVTTVTGLCIAIPVLLLHAWLSRRVRASVAQLEEATLHFVNGLRNDEDSSDA